MASRECTNGVDYWIPALPRVKPGSAGMTVSRGPAFQGLSWGGISECAAASIWARRKFIKLFGDHAASLRRPDKLRSDCVALDVFGI